MQGVATSVYLLVVISIVFFAGFAASAKPPKLLLISLDGLRYDFITPTRTPALWLLARQGVFLERGVKATVHTVTASNHYSIVTGLYQESHGIIDNAFWDPALNETYDLWNFRSNKTQYERSKLAYWYKGTTPLWQTNEEAKYSTQYDSKNKRRSGSLFWPMGDCFINNRTIFRNKTWEVYGDEFVWRKEIDTLISWFTDEKEPVNFLLYYNAQPDHIEHSSDVYGPATGSVVDQIDATMGYLFERLRATSLLDEVNIILTADHGHTNIPDKDHLILLTDYFDYNRTIVNARSIFPKPGSGVTEEEIYENLTRAQKERRLPMQVWRKDEFPVHYHWANNSRVGPVIVFEHLNYELVLYGSIEAYTGKKPLPKSTHGWLNDYAEMRAFFIAHGPAFKKGYVDSKEDIENIDIYPLMCKILGIDPLPNNGSLDRIKSILRDDFGVSDTAGNWSNPYLIKLSKPKDYWGLTLVIIPVVSLAILAFLCLANRFYRRNAPRAKDGGGLGYRLLRNASPETHIDMTKRPSAPRNKDPTAPSNGPLAMGASELTEEMAKKMNGNRRRSPNNVGEDGRRQLVRLSDEELSDDEL